MNSQAPNPWYFALVAIDPTWSLYAEAFDPSLFFFIILHLLQRNVGSGGYSRQSSRAYASPKKQVVYPYTREEQRWGKETRGLFTTW